MSPDTNGNPPSVVKRKKKINPNKKCIESDCNCFINPQVYSKGTLPNVPSYSFGNSINTQNLMTLPSISSNCKNCLYSSDVFKNMQTSEFSDGHEYSSLPTVNMQSNATSTARRFSDPGLPNDSDSSTSTVDESVIQKLKSQVNYLKENNHRLTREIEDLRLEVNLLKQHNFKQYNREYEPGLIADIIREVRDAAKVREDAFFARVKHLMEEQHQQLGLNQMHFLTEKQKNNDRISKLEEQLKSLNLVTNRSENSSSLSLTSLNGNNANSARQVLELEREALELRRELQDTRAKKEASDQKIMLLDKKLLNLMRCDEVQSSDASDDGKAESESISSSGITNTSVLSQHPRITLSGPVTDL